MIYPIKNYQFSQYILSHRFNQKIWTWFNIICAWKWKSLWKKSKNTNLTKFVSFPSRFFYFIIFHCVNWYSLERWQTNNVWLRNSVIVKMIRSMRIQLKEFILQKLNKNLHKCHLCDKFVRACQGRQSCLKLYLFLSTYFRITLHKS